MSVSEHDLKHRIILLYGRRIYITCAQGRFLRHLLASVWRTVSETFRGTWQYDDYVLQSFSFNEKSPKIHMVRQDISQLYLHKSIYK
jgi:hypothetical protein